MIQYRLISRLVMLNSVVVKNVHVSLNWCVMFELSFITSCAWVVRFCLGGLARTVKSCCWKDWDNDDDETILMMMISGWEPAVHTTYCMSAVNEITKGWKSHCIVFKGSLSDFFFTGSSSPSHLTVLTSTNIVIPNISSIIPQGFKRLQCNIGHDWQLE